MANEWTKWSGGEMPVHGHVLVEVRLRNGVVATDGASLFTWQRLPGLDLDVVEYRAVGH